MEDKYPKREDVLEELSSAREMQHDALLRIIGALHRAHHLNSGHGSTFIGEKIDDAMSYAHVLTESLLKAEEARDYLDSMKGAAEKAPTATESADRMILLLVQQLEEKAREALNSACDILSVAEHLRGDRAETIRDCTRIAVVNINAIRLDVAELAGRVEPASKEEAVRQ